MKKFFKVCLSLSMVLIILVALSLPCFAAPIKLTVDLYDEFLWSVEAYDKDTGTHNMKPGTSGDWTYYVNPNGYYDGKNCTSIVLNYPLPFDGYFVIKCDKFISLNAGYSYALNNEFAVGVSGEPCILAYKIGYGDKSNKVLYEDEIFGYADEDPEWHTATSNFTVRSDKNISQTAFKIEIMPFQTANKDSWSYASFHLCFTDFYFEVDDPMFNPGIFEPPTSNAWDDSKEELSSMLGDLPNSDDVDLSKVDISNFRAGLNCIKTMFNGFVSKTGLSSLLVFVLTFSLCVYLIGRKVG